jgi:formylglycine-generating enzyme required for sulfatase activity
MKPRRGTSPVGLYLTLTLAACAGCGESESTPSDADASPAGGPGGQGGEPTPGGRGGEPTLGGQGDEPPPGGAVVPSGYVRIEPGAFTMGSPPDESGRDEDETQHPVSITRAFALKATEVTQAEWRAVMGSNPSYFANCGDTCPVETVSWFDAVDYLNRLSDSNALQRCYADDDVRTFVGLECEGYRLPTEAEWEYAARAGASGAAYDRRPMGDEQFSPCIADESLDEIAWYCANAQGTTQPVKSRAPNAWGLYDTLGNVWEWTLDWYDEYPTVAVVDPVSTSGTNVVDMSGNAYGLHRVLRGASWRDSGPFVRPASRAASHPDDESGPVTPPWHGVGLRPARTLP